VDIIKQKPPLNNGGFKALKFWKTHPAVYDEITGKHPVDCCRYQVLNCFIYYRMFIEYGNYMKSGSKILFDDSCPVCNNSIALIIRNGGKSTYQFLSLHSEEGKKNLRKFGFPDDYDKSVVLLENKRAYTKSDAILRIFKNLKGFVHLLYWFKIVPRVLRDAIYNLVAKNRHILSR